MKTLITEFKQVTKVNQGKIQDQEVSQQPILYSIIFKEIEKKHNNWYWFTITV